MDADTWLRNYQQDAAQRVERAQDIKAQLASSSASASSPDGAVTVTVGPSGALQNLELSPRADDLSRTQLTKAILKAAREAHRKVAECLVQAVRPLIGDGEATSFLESQVPPAEDGPDTRPPRYAGDDYDDSNSILRR